MQTINDDQPKRTRRPNGSGSIIKRSDGRWLAKIQIGVQSNGKPKLKYLYGKTEAEVKNKLKEYKRDLDLGIATVKKVTLNTYIENWLKIYKYKKIKSASYDRLESTFMRHIEPTLGSLLIGNVTTRDVQELINEKIETLSYSSIKKIYELLNACFNHAKITGDIYKNPMAGVAMPNSNHVAVKAKEIQILSSEEIGRIENVVDSACETGDNSFRYAPIFVFMLNTGLRMGETLALRWDNVELNKEPAIIRVTDNLSKIKNREGDSSNKIKLIITDTKTKNGNRIVPLNQKAVRALNQIKEFQSKKNIKTEFVICNNAGKPIDPAVFQRAFDRVLKKSGVKHYGLHSLRHTFGSRALRNGIDIKVVSELLGHSNINITYNKYIHIVKEQKIHAVKLLDNL